MWIALGIGLIATIIFLWLRVTKGDLWGLFSKAVASLCFILLSITALYQNPEDFGFGFFILFGLICGMLGDIWLDLKWIYLKDANVFLYAGFISFMIGHVAFITAQHSVTEMTALETTLSIVFALIIAGVSLLIEKPMKLQYGKFKTIVFFYTFVLSLTMTTAMVLAVTTHFALVWTVFSVGALSFLLSDLVLSGMYFGKGKNTKGNILLNHILYYAAQFTIAFTIALVK